MQEADALWRVSGCPLPECVCKLGPVVDLIGLPPEAQVAASELLAVVQTHWPARPMDDIALAVQECKTLLTPRLVAHILTSAHVDTGCNVLYGLSRSDRSSCARHCTWLMNQGACPNVVRSHRCCSDSTFCAKYCMWYMNQSGPNGIRWVSGQDHWVPDALQVLLLAGMYPILSKENREQWLRWHPRRCDRRRKWVHAVVSW